MSLQNWQDNGWLKPHHTDLQELSNLLAIVDRDLGDAQTSGLSLDWQFGIAYNAALKLCTMMLFAAGYRPENALAHYRTLHSIEYTLGPQHKEDAIYLDACRNKRNVVEYENVGRSTASEVAELVTFVTRLRQEVLNSLRPRFPDLGNSG